MFKYGIRRMQKKVSSRLVCGFTEWSMPRLHVSWSLSHRWDGIIFCVLVVYVIASEDCDSLF